MIVYDLMGQTFTLYLGRQGENNARALTFDLSAIRQKYGNGNLSLALKRPGDARPFPVVVDVSGDQAIWTVSNVETDIPGIGEAQFTYTVDGVIKKTVIYRTKVEPSLTPLSEKAPDPFDNWLDELSSIGGQIVADKAEALENIADARTGALSDIEAARADAVSDIESAEADAVASVDSAGRNAITAVTQARADALTDVSAEATRAVNEIHKEAEDASGYADEASRSATEAKASEDAASDYADQARSYAENLHFTESSSGNIVISIGGGN